MITVESVLSELSATELQRLARALDVGGGKRSKAQLARLCVSAEPDLDALLARCPARALANAIGELGYDTTDARAATIRREVAEILRTQVPPYAWAFPGLTHHVASVVAEAPRARFVDFELGPLLGAYGHQFDRRPPWKQSDWDELLGVMMVAFWIEEADSTSDKLADQGPIFRGDVTEFRKVLQKDLGGTSVRAWLDGSDFPGLPAALRVARNSA